MRIRKPNRVTTSRRAVQNGARSSHASMPRARGRWRLGPARNQADAPGRREAARSSEDIRPPARPVPALAAPDANPARFPGKETDRDARS